MAERKWYVTFPQRLASRNQYFVIEAPTYRDAREQAVRLFGSEWAFLYDEAGFAGQAEQYGLTETTR